MTEKHIWKNGETITADLLNGMSDYVDDQVNTIPVIVDPDTVVHLLDGPNLVANGHPMSSTGWGVSNDSPWKSTIVPGQYWEIPVTPSGKGDYLQIYQQLTTFPSAISQMRSGDRIDMSLEVLWTGGDDVSGITIDIAVKQGGMGTATKPVWEVIKSGIPLDMPADTWKRIEFSGIVPDGIEANAAGKDGLERFYFSVGQATDTGSTATIRLCNFSVRTDHQYTAKPVTSVGGQVPGEDGDINMDGYVLQADFDALNNTVNALKLQIWGGHNLIDVTDSIKNKMLDSNGAVSTYGSGDLCKNLIAVSPGEKLHFYASQPVDSTYCFRWNYYDADGNFVARKSSPLTSDFDLTMPDNVYYIWISYPNVGEVSVTRVTAYDMINAQITAQAEQAEQGGTTE